MSFYTITYDMDKYERSGIMAYHSELNDLDMYVVSRGRIIDNWNSNITFNYDLSEGNVITDYICNDLSWLIISDRFKRTMEQSGVSGIQYLNVNIIDKNNNESLGEFYVANICNLIHGIDMDKSGYIDCGNNIKVFVTPVLKADKVLNYDIFRLIESETEIFISEKIKKIIEDSKLTGFDFTKIMLV